MQLSEAVIQITAKGMGQFQGQINTVKKGLDESGKAAEKARQEQEKAAKKAQDWADQVRGNLTSAFERVGAVAARAFAGASAAVGGFLRLAAPTEFNELTAALGQIGVRLGSIFIPLLRAAVDQLNQFRDYLRQLTPEQKQQILNWVETGLAVAAGIVAVQKMTGVLQGLAGGVSLVSNALKLLAGSNPFGWIFLAVGGIVALVTSWDTLSDGLEKGGGLIGTLRNLWDGFMAVIQRVWEAMKPFVDAFVGMVTAMVDTVMAAFDTLQPYITEAVNAITAVVEALRPVFATVFGAIFQIISTTIKYLMKAFIALAVIIREALHGNFDITDIGNKINEKLAEFDRKLEERTGKRIQKKAPENKKQAKQEDFTPKQRMEKPELVELTSLWAKAQTSITDDPKVKIAQEQRDLAMRQVQLQERIAENTAVKAPVGAAR